MKISIFLICFFLTVCLESCITSKDNSKGPPGGRGPSFYVGNDGNIEAESEDPFAESQSSNNPSNNPNSSPKEEGDNNAFASDTEINEEQNPELEENAEQINQSEPNELDINDEGFLANQNSNNNIFKQSNEPANQVINQTQNTATAKQNEPLQQNSNNQLQKNQNTQQNVVINPQPLQSKEINASAQATLWWIGLNVEKQLAIARVELVTIGVPQFDFIQETNAIGQKELIIRYYQTKLRNKLKMPLDAREFYSPVAYIRTRQDPNEQFVDVIITLREAINPKYFALQGNILLTFPLTEKYLNPSKAESTPAEIAQPLKDDFEFRPVMLAGSETPKSVPIHPDPGSQAFANVSENTMQAINQNNSNLSGENNSTIENSLTKTGNSNSNNNVMSSNNNNSENNLPNTESNDDENSNSEDNDEFENSEELDNNNETESENEDNQTAIYPSFHKTIEEETFGFLQVAQDEFDFESDNSDLDFAIEDSNQSLNTDQTTENSLINNTSPSNENAQTAANNSQELTENSSNEEIKEVEGEEEDKDQSKSKFPPVNMEFKEAKLRDVIRALSTENNTNFIFPQDVGDASVTMSFKNVPWDEALEAVLETHSLGMTKLKGQIVRIDKLTTLEQEKKSLESVRKSAALLIPTKVLVIRLSYADAEDAQKIIQDMLPSQEYDNRVKVKADKRTNSVIIEAIPDDLQKIRTLVERIDQQTPQVKISTRVIEVLKDVKKFLGINWGGIQQYNQGRGLGFGNLAFPSNMQSIFSVDTGAQTATQSGQWDISFGSINNAIELDLRLRMAEINNYTRGLQNSTVIVLDNEQAMIQAGQIDYFQVPTGDGQNQLTSVEYTLKLEVTPQVTADGAIQMQIKVENGEPKEVTTNSATSKNIRTVNTNMLRQNGETAVIGGLYTTLIRKSTQGVPLLSDLPIIGALFRSHAHAEDKRELMIMVTPTVLNSDKALTPKLSSEGQLNLVNSTTGLEGNTAPMALNTNGQAVNNQSINDQAISNQAINSQAINSQAVDNMGNNVPTNLQENSENDDAADEELEQQSGEGNQSNDTLSDDELDVSEE